ncbi:alpha-galactosidase [Proteiniphilum sp. UBA5384]|jgi:alpha-galactosidase|uniref:alpha-galactosidase n=1 Tax=Proteiniphilum sp. UBA5384 TaxID=1947279 RepID=UPI0025D0945F|nr:alpha-galactosidase [Proteiniphilum sp. UBA5384]
MILKIFTPILLFGFLGVAGLHSQNMVYEISTKGTSLIYTVGKDNRLIFRYYGTKIDNSVQFESVRGYGKADTNREMNYEAYPAFGLGYVNEPALSLIHGDGSLITELKLENYVVNKQPNIHHFVFYLKDEVYDLSVELHTEAYLNEDVINQWVTITNNEPKPITLKNFYSSFLSIRANSYYLTHFNGTWAGEMNLTEERLGYGVKSIESKKGVRTTQTENASFILSLDQPTKETSGICIGGALAWSGNYKLSFELNEYDYLNILGGMNPFMSEYKLNQGEKLETPKMIYTYSNKGKGQISRNFHDWARKYSLNKGYEERPIVLNSWEGAYFDFNEQIIKDMIDNAAKLGAELFVLDDGWFGNKYPRNNARAGLGDWQVNTKKLPNGLQYLIDHATQRGIKFGIWIEPEMVNPKSELAERHPEWIVQSNGREKTTIRNQLLLDLSNPQVQDFIWNMIDDLLSSHHGIAYIKWDANRHVEQVGSSYLPADKQTHFWIDYTKGLYVIYEKIRNKYPDLIFQACASGGGRVDYGALKYHDEFWTSDNTDALRRVYMQYSTNLIYPAVATAAHVSTVPGHQTGSIIPLKFRFDVAMSGRLGLELQPRDIPEEEWDFAEQAIENYKTHVRELVTKGDLYRLISPYDRTNNHSSNIYIRKDKSKAVLFVYCTDFNNRGVLPKILLQGLDNNKKYRITEINKTKNKSCFWGNEMIFDGEYLMNAGIELQIARQYDSAVFILEETNPSGCVN